MKKKSLVGWTTDEWENGIIQVPRMGGGENTDINIEISEDSKEWKRAVKVRITIEEIK